jgi:DEAD/DEAH box helicase domain-containing protein
MKFSELYKENVNSVVRALTAIWCGEPSNDAQRASVKEIKKTIKNLFAPETAIPVVQCMNSYKSVYSVSVDEAKKVVGSLWKKTYSPYEHQYISWKTLLEEKSEDGKPMSICVTTGTGSGKTECFMMPLVADLLRKPKENQIQALFLYPLNALMEDQKERLEELLDGTNLTFAVYNGDLPEKEPKPSDHGKDATLLRRRIEQITGGTYKEERNPDTQRMEFVLKDNKFPRMYYTREQVRQTPPNILLTNPTMLEYILLRGSDAALIDPDAKSLDWVVIDETHTYTGAGAAELAMLLRRVLLAFNKDARDVHFATSSATFGNGADPTEEEKKLKAFIAGITGTSTQQVRVIDGKREGKIPEGEDEKRWRLIFDKEYVSLNELFPETDTIEHKLELLDEMCNREEQRCREQGKKVPDMKVKVHYFYRVPNNGFYVRLTEQENGSFKIYTEKSIDNKSLAQSKVPLLELGRCKHCGEYVAVGRVNTQTWKIEAPVSDDSDMFDIDVEEDDDSDSKYAFFGLSNSSNKRGDNNMACQIAPDGTLQPIKPNELKEGQWHLVVNTHFSCPNCGSKQTRKGAEADVDSNGIIENLKLAKFRLSPDFISRLLAPSVLDQLDKGKSQSGRIVLHDGQQYISFVDSRQAAAENTLRQNLEEERQWFYSIIFHELCRRAASQAETEKKIQQLKEKMAKLDEDSDEYDELYEQRKRLRKSLNGAISWEEVAEVISRDPLCDTFANLFVKRSGDSEELDENGNIRSEVKEQYVESLMVKYLANRLTTTASNETMGLFHVCYPQLSRLELPEEVSRFNNLMHHDENRISKTDWQHLIQIFMDYTVRSNQSYFLRLSSQNPIDIFSSVRFATEKPRRRPVNKLKLEPDKVSRSRVVRYLCALIHRDDPRISMTDAQRTYFNQLEEVMNALWATLTNPENELLETATRWNEERHCHEPEADNAPRLNLKNLSFELYHNVWLCDTNTGGEERHVKRLRPVENTFKNFSPYLSGSTPVELDEELHETWTPYPYWHGCGTQPSREELWAWAKGNRKLLWNHHLWGEDGIFSDRLDDIYRFPNLFIQAEHTAQVDKDVARGLQNDFKDHAINILACSTTMEMGVDLGNLEVVMLQSVPPMPANYKQRAGRSGRNNKVRSACITLCSSDAIGLRTLHNPIEKIITRPVKVPTIDLMSPQVVQRHVNSFLVREFGVFTAGEKGGSLNQKVVDYYTNFSIRSGRDGHLVILDANNGEVSPDRGIGDDASTLYERFNNKCLEPIESKLRGRLSQLLRNTIFDGQCETVVNKALEDNDRCYSELNSKLQDLRYAYVHTNPLPEKFRTKLKMQYLELLNQRLLNFWATNRFTPNANMPVNVLTLDLNSTSKSFLTNRSSSNPSYTLREAIAQYAPGNSVVVDGVVYAVRGVDFTNIYQGVKSFKTIYRNSDKTVVDDATALDNMIPWNVNGELGVQLIQPVGFLPDINEEKSRIIDQYTYTRVSAQLIDTDDWVNLVTEPHLFSVRSNRETGDAKILYYNEGKGYGYCFCPRCGRAVLEEDIADENDPLNFPYEFNNKMSHPKDGSEGRPFHFAISGKNARKPCSGSSNSEVVKRNVIIGDMIQTDYSEIRIRHKGSKKWMSNRNSEENLLFTLAIVFSQTLVDILGKERGAVDFAIMPNAHICIFDTNPGGAGYANQLSNILVMKSVIRASKQLLEEAKARNSEDMLLDKSTLRFLKYIDVEKALEWIHEEEEASNVLPDEVKAIYPDAAETSIYHLLKAAKKSHKEMTLFADNIFVGESIDGWNYDDNENGWRAHLIHNFLPNAENTDFCLTESSEAQITEPIMMMMRKIEAWAGKGIKKMDNPYKDSHLYPLAYIDGVLYFNNNREHAVLNNKWGKETMYSVRTANPALHAKTVDCSYHPNTKLVILSGEKYQQINTDQLGKILSEEDGGIISSFIEKCRNSKDNLEISYQDEHLKSILGIVFTLQTIEYFVSKIGKSFTLKFLIEKYTDANYKFKFNANLPTSYKRDEWLNKLAKKWLNNVNATGKFKGKLSPIESLDRNKLPHWRVLIIKCGEETLSIYPDGGFMNGWNFKVRYEPGVYQKHYTVDNTTTEDIIPLERVQDIKFDITIE